MRPGIKRRFRRMVFVARALKIARKNRLTACRPSSSPRATLLQNRLRRKVRPGGGYCQRVVIPLFFTKLMLTHIVCWKYKAETTPEMRADHRAKLMALPKIIRNSVSFNVGEDILHLERSFDTGLVAVFTDRAALDFYSDHPEHQKVAALGRGISEKVVSVDFLSE